MLCTQGFSSLAALFDQFGLIDWGKLGHVRDDRRKRLMVGGVTGRFRTLVRTTALLWRVLVVAGMGLLRFAVIAIVLVVVMAARVGPLVGGLIVRVLLIVVVVARSLIVPRLRRSRSASAVNGVVIGWGRSRSNCLVLDNLAFGCRTVRHADSLGAVRNGLSRCRVEQAGAK
jgi:hypothetical protein